MLRSLDDRSPEPAPSGPATSSADAAPPPSPWRAVPFLLGGYLLVFAAVTMMNVALPAAQRDLGMSDGARQWVITLYSMAFGGLMLLGGRVADVVGLRRTVAIGLWAFAGASLLGAAATNGVVLLAARVLQGAAGALVAPGGLALLSVMFVHGEQRARAFGVLGIVMGIGTAGSFVVGGWLTDALSWRWCLLVNAPLALVAAVGLSRTAPESLAAARPRLDVIGAVMTTAAVAALVLGFDQATKHGWRAPWTLTLLAAGALLLAAFVAASRRSEQPLLPLALVADRTRGSAFLAVFVLAIGMFAGFYFVTLYLQDVLGYSALRTGVAFVPFGVTAMASSRAVAAWSGRLSAATPLVIGLLAIAAGVGLLSRLTPFSSYATDVLPSMLLLGIGGSAVMVTASNLATIGAGVHSGVAGAAVGATQQVGAALGTALLSSIAAGATSERFGADAGETSDPAWLAAVVDGFARAGAVGATVVVVGAVTVWAVTARRPS